MKFVLASDSFKESMTAQEACLAMQKGIFAHHQEHEVQLCPLADGGGGNSKNACSCHGWND